MESQNSLVLLLQLNQYENFYTIVTLSEKFGKEQFLIKKSICNSELIPGLIYNIFYTECDRKYNILEIFLHEKINLDRIEAIRLFGIQSICALINKIIYNIDDINKMVKLVPKLLLILIHENWIKIYLYMEFRILLMYDINNIVKNCNKVKQINQILRRKILNSSKRVYFIEKLNDLEDLWCRVDQNLMMPKERFFFYKLLSNK